MVYNIWIIFCWVFNLLLCLCENLWYMKAIYFIVGYKICCFEIDVFLYGRGQEFFLECFWILFIVIIFFIIFLCFLLFWIFLFFLVFFIGVIVNVLKVKFMGVDLFGSVGEFYLGWIFLVIFIVIFFVIICLNLYIMLIYLLNIYNEIKQCLFYILELIK